jgi:hypothetical protein
MKSISCGNINITIPCKLTDISIFNSKDTFQPAFLTLTVTVLTAVLQSMTRETASYLRYVDK